MDYWSNLNRYSIFHILSVTPDVVEGSGSSCERPSSCSTLWFFNKSTENILLVVVSLAIGYLHCNVGWCCRTIQIWIWSHWNKSRSTSQFHFKPICSSDSHTNGDHLHSLYMSTAEGMIVWKQYFHSPDFFSYVCNGNIMGKMICWKYSFDTELHCEKKKKLLILRRKLSQVVFCKGI